MNNEDKMIEDLWLMIRSVNEIKRLLRNVFEGEKSS
ncbi:hypothetical protein GR28A_00015 [Vibrio phage vB_VcorM_GR28A]|nr:hypothetical protein GR28A_00015 [Vibrio phage vB_VcorM_GR28A]